jgi:hypothetical protein
MCGCGSGGWRQRGKAVGGGRRQRRGDYLRVVFRSPMPNLGDQGTFFSLGGKNLIIAKVTPHQLFHHYRHTILVVLISYVHQAMEKAGYKIWNSNPEGMTYKYFVSESQLDPADTNSIGQIVRSP